MFTGPYLRHLDLYCKSVTLESVTKLANIWAKSFGHGKIIGSSGTRTIRQNTFRLEDSTDIWIFGNRHLRKSTQQAVSL